MSDRPPASLDRLATLAGVALSYRDVWGAERKTDESAIRAVLAAMDIAAATPSQIADSIAAFEAEAWRALLPPVVVCRSGPTALHVAIALPARLDGGRILWSVIDEGGATHEGAAATDTLEVEAAQGEGEHRHRRLVLPLPPLPLGYHRLYVAAGHENAETDVFVVPASAYLPPAIRDGGRAWGLTAQLYGLRSARNWGIGDYDDLAALAEIAGGRGAKLLGVNPLHALFPAVPQHASPYSPSTRLFLNPLYLDIGAIPDLAECEEARAFLASPGFAASLAVARAAEQVDYDSVTTLKGTAFAALHRCFAQRHLGPGAAAATERGAAFRRFQQAGGATLASYGLFTALHRRMSEAHGFSWRDWPEAFRQPDSAAVQSFAAEHASEIELHHYLEWEGDRQFAASAARGQAAGLDIYRDLAVGVDPNGAEAWADPALLAAGATIGAPPDFLNVKGQDWGLAPINPRMLRQRSYTPFIAALRANMRHAGVLRIDHAMALKQLYWVPRGAGPVAGAYVSYPLDDLLGILALESERQRCAVIGEDLGTVPAGFSARLNRTEILSYRVLQFERAPDGGFLPPSCYPRPAAATVSTHDIGTLAGFWLARDLVWRRQLDLYPDAPSAENDETTRRADRRRLLDALLAEKLMSAEAAQYVLPRDDQPIFALELAEAVHRFLGRTVSALALLQIEDALCEVEQANLPGTVQAHPNWRHKLSCALEDLAADDGFCRIAAAIDMGRTEIGQ